ncbi:NTP transferase domain-containing protein [bacterium]|nr:NTP transferase domain-containing protein [bacterium]
MRAVIMAGGQGSRLRPLTCNRPKPLVPVCNRPVMEYAIELLRRHKIRTCLVTLHYLADEVMAYFGNGSEWEMRLLYSVEDEPLGTAGSIKRIQEYLNETFVVVSGDALTDFDLTKAIEFHRAKKADVTMVLTRVPNPLEFGIVVTGADGRIQRFLEKPSWGEVVSDTINTGIYILEPHVLDRMEPKRAYDFSMDLFPQMLADQAGLYGHVAEGYWCDIGNLEQYRQAQLDMLEGKVGFSPPGQNLGDGVWVGPGTQLDPAARLKGPLLVGRNCRIRREVRLSDSTVIGDNCIVEDGASLERAVLWGNTYVGRKSRAFGAVLCRNVTLQSHASVAEGAVVGDNVFVGRGATLQPDVKVWPDKNVEAGAAVSMSLIWGRKWPGSLFSDDGICGLGNIEITPEYALKLGAAYGAVLPKGAVVVASRDSHPATRMINRALICGLVSVGVSVRDLQAVPTPVGRNALRNAADCYGGIHVRVNSRDPRQLQLEFLDASGVNIDRTWERKIENRFFREDFRRTPMDEVGMIEFPIRILEQYQEAFTAQIDVEVLRQARYKVVIDYGHGHASTVLPRILGRLGIEAVSLNAYIDSHRGPRSEVTRGQLLEQLSSIVTTLHTDLGVAIDATGERLMVVDEKGGLWQGAKLLVLFATLVMQRSPGAMIAVPVNAPSVLGELAKKYAAKVILARTDSRSLTYTALLGDTRFHLAATSQGEFAFPSFSSGFDGMFAFAKFLEMVCFMKKPISEYEAEIPDLHLRHYQVECEIAAKGRVMRALLERLGDKQVEVIDGVKVFETGGWVLIVPHRSLPEMQMWVEAESDERMAELAEEYRGMIRTLAQEVPQPSAGSSPPQPAAAVIPAMVSEDRAFHFWTSGRYLGVKARTLREFVDTLHYVDGDSLAYHLERNDFANWLELELGEAQLAGQVRQLRAHKMRGESLRAALLQLFASDNEERLLNQGVSH